MCADTVYHLLFAGLCSQEEERLKFQSFSFFAFFAFRENENMRKNGMCNTYIPFVIRRSVLSIGREAGLFHTFFARNSEFFSLSRDKSKVQRIAKYNTYIPFVIRRSVLSRGREAGP